MQKQTDYNYSYIYCQCQVTNFHRYNYIKQVVTCKHIPLGPPPVGNPIQGVTYFHAPQRMCSTTPAPLDFSWLEGLRSSCTHCNKAAQQDSHCCNHHCWLRDPEMTVEAVYLSELGEVVGTKGSSNI